jgi:hypothetical protein
MKQAMLNNHYLRNRICLVMSLVLFFIAFSVSARGVYQTPEDFLAETFDQDVPKSQVVWVKGDVRDALEDILGHRYAGLRIRYWKKQERSAWILDEIGKEEPITFGVIINTDKVERVKVLAFRESRGGEIRHRAFTQQFKDIGLQEMKLDRHIDGVSGATMSVRAMTAVTTLALYLATLTSEDAKLL